MDKPLVSIIIPVYKVEKYLEKCLDSVLNQTYTNIEVILIDDGSPDNCPQICDNYALKDNRVRVIHSTNKGVSTARNSGLKVANGEYIMFCDSDDYVVPNWCEVLVKTKQQYKDDLVSCDFVNIDQNEKSPALDIVNDYDVKKVSYFELYKTARFSYIWNKIFTTSVIRENNIWFDDSCGYGEDAFFVVEYSAYCEDQLMITAPLYYYVQREGSLIHTYYPNLFEMHLPIFEKRIACMPEDKKVAYCDDWLFRFIDMFSNVFDERNKMNFFKKLKSNQKMVCTKEFQYCVHKASGKKENPRMIKLLKNKNYYAYWLLDSIAKIKAKNK